MSTDAAHLVPLSPLERFLRLFARVEGNEGAASLLLLANIFLLLMAYYFIKPVREGWLAISDIQGLTKLETKAYSAFAQSLLLIAVLPLYAWLAALWPRKTLVTRVGLFFTALLGIFWLVQPGFLFDHLSYAGVAFYIFVGIFGVTLVAQFWSFAADFFGEEKGRRLFPLVAIGAAGGAAVGAWAGEQLIESEQVEAMDLLLLAAVPLVGALLVARLSERVALKSGGGDRAAQRAAEPAATSNEGAFRLLRNHRYLAAMALLVLLFNWVVSSGDNVLFAAVQQALAEEFSATGVAPADHARLLRNATTAFYGDLYFWVNLVTLLLQAFIVSRMLRWVGFGTVLLATPVISLAAYVSMAIAPVIGVIKVMKIAENASNYSINNTARHMLWLPTSKSMLYQAKPAVDTIFVRIGDGLAALTVMLGTRLWDLEVVDYFYVNIGIILLWLGVAGFLLREHRSWSSSTETDHS